MFKNEVIKNRVLMSFLISVWDQILRSKDFQKIFKFVFILSHGQSFTQRTSSLNKAITGFNIHKENLSWPLVYLWSAKKSGKDMYEFLVAKDLWNNCKLAHLRESLMGNKSRVILKSIKKDLKRKAKKEEIEVVKSKKSMPRKDFQHYNRLSSVKQLILLPM